MKKIHILILLFFINIAAFSQDIYSVYIGGGLSCFSIDTKESSNIGFNIPLTINKFYFDISANIFKADGYTMKLSVKHNLTNQISLLAINVGYIIPINKKENISFIPNIGVIQSYNIYENHIGVNTHYLEADKKYVNVGLITSFVVSPFVNINVGVGSKEIFKTTIMLGFNSNK